MSGLGRKVKSQSPDNPAMAHDAPEARPDENGEDQPMYGPHNPPGLSPCGWPVPGQTLLGMAEVRPTLPDAEVMDDSDGSFNSKRNRNVTNRPPDQPSSSDSSHHHFNAPGAVGQDPEYHMFQKEVKESQEKFFKARKARSEIKAPGAP